LFRGEFQDRLMIETWNLTGCDLVPKLTTLRIPTVVSMAHCGGRSRNRYMAEDR
jgi:hypothetical protein